MKIINKKKSIAILLGALMFTTSLQAAWFFPSESFALENDDKETKNSKEETTNSLSEETEDEECKYIKIEGVSTAVPIKGCKWINVKGYFHFVEDGKLVKGWKRLTKAHGEKTVHFSYFDKSNGRLYTGWHNMSKKEGEKKDHWSYFGSNGWLRTGWQKMGTRSNPDGDNEVHWSYFGEDGWLRTGWKKMGTKANPDGKNKVHWSFFGYNGWLRTEWQYLTKEDGEKTPHWSYFGGGGWLTIGKKTISGMTYQFDARGWLTKGSVVNNGCYLISPISKTDYAIDIKGASAKDGAIAQIHSKNGNAAQKFQVKHISGNIYSIKTGTNIYDSALTINGKANAGAGVIQKKYKETDSQKWRIVPISEGKFAIRTFDGKFVLEAVNSNNTLRIAKWTGKDNQTFKFTKTSGFLFRNVRKYYYNSNGQKPLTGIDVSKHNGTIDWKQVKSDGIDFAIIRTSYGYESNYEKWEWKTIENIKGCEANGIPYGVYFYSIATTQEQADKEVALVKKILGNRKPKLGVYIDVEDSAIYTKVFGSTTSAGARRKITDLTKRMSKKLKSYGYKVGIYSYANFFSNTLYMNELKGDYVWGARYYSNSRADTKSLPNSERTWHIWQYSSVGTVKGIDGRVDMNTVINKYW